MKCPECKTGELVQNDRLPLQEVGHALGLESVQLIDEPGLQCEKCGSVMVTGELLATLIPMLAAAMAQISDLGADEARFLRKTLDLTQQELAERLQISRATIARWEDERDGGLRGADSYALRALVGTHFLDINPDIARQIFASLKATPKASPPPSYILDGLEASA
jgi:transcriptional regulator with XRE-family HTH domain